MVDSDLVVWDLAEVDPGVVGLEDLEAVGLEVEMALVDLEEMRGRRLMRGRRHCYPH